MQNVRVIALGALAALGLGAVALLPGAAQAGGPRAKTALIKDFANQGHGQVQWSPSSEEGASNFVVAFRGGLPNHAYEVELHSSLGGDSDNGFEYHVTSSADGTIVLKFTDSTSITCGNYIVIEDDPDSSDAVIAYAYLNDLAACPT